MKSKGRVPNKITALAKKISGLASKAVASYSPEVEAIISSGCKEKRRIEVVLDGMLDFCWDKKTLGLYKKLCKYYYGIDQRATVGYVYAYRDMWDTKE